MTIARMTGLAVLVLELAARVVAARAGGVGAEVKLVPGSRFFVSAPEVGLMQHDSKPARCEVFIPEDYDPQEPVALLAWLGGGPGSDVLAASLGIAGRSGFVQVALPYRKGSDGGAVVPTLDGKPDYANASGALFTRWPFYRALLDEVEKVVPNIDPQRRVCGGFSNGGTAQTFLIAFSKGGFQSYFYAFMILGAGYPFGGFETVRDRPMLFGAGVEDRNFFKTIQATSRRFKSAGADVTWMAFENTDHAIPAARIGDIRRWLHQAVTENAR